MNGIKCATLLTHAGPDEEAHVGQNPEEDVADDQHAKVKRYVILIKSEVLNDCCSVGVVGNGWEVV